MKRILTVILTAIFMTVPVYAADNLNFNQEVQVSANNEYITRAEFVDMVYSNFDEPTRDKIYMNVNAFKDVPTDAWYNIPVSSLANAGILYGNRCGYFLPDKPIKKAEAVAILSRCIYADNCQSEGHWAQDMINSAYSQGWIDDTLNPEQNLTSAEAINMFTSFLEKLR